MGLLVLVCVWKGGDGSGAKVSGGGGEMLKCVKVSMRLMASVEVLLGNSSEDVAKIKVGPRHAADRVCGLNSTQLN